MFDVCRESKRIAFIVAVFICREERVDVFVYKRTIIKGKLFISVRLLWLRMSFGAGAFPFDGA